MGIDLATVFVITAAAVGAFLITSVLTYKIGMRIFFPRKKYGRWYG